MKQPLKTISDIYDQADSLHGNLIYVIGIYNRVSRNAYWDGGSITDDQASINVTKDSQFGNYDNEYLEQHNMVYAVKVSTLENYVNVTILHIYRVPRLRPYLKVKCRLKEKLKPHILIVKPMRDTAVMDMKEAMGDTYDKYAFTIKTLPYRINNGKKETKDYKTIEDYYLLTLKDYIKERQWDLVCFLSEGSSRDGQPYYGILMNDGIIHLISRLRYPSVCAIGHADEFRNFDHAFDDSVATPSLLGVKLTELYHKYYKKH